MGVDFNCYVYYGLKLEADDFKELISPAVYENQPRYDTRTGQVTSTKRVLVKQEQSVYRFAGLEDIEFEDLLYKVAKNLELDYERAEYGDYYILGHRMFKPESYRRHDLAEGSCTLDDLMEYHNDIVKKFPGMEDYIGLHAMPRVG